MNGGGFLIYIREGVLAKQLKDFTTPCNIECGIVEDNLHKKGDIVWYLSFPISKFESFS